MTSRRSLTTMQRIRVYTRANGLCHICGQPCGIKEWDVEHIIPLALGGADDDSNMAPAHKACHADKTRADAGQWSKAKRRQAKHIGAKRGAGFWKPAGAKFDWKQGRYVREDTP